MTREMALSRRRLFGHAALVASGMIADPNLLAHTGASRGRSRRGVEAMEDALALLAKTGPEYQGRLANHGPMAAEALVQLERPEAVVPWVESYRKRLREHPPGSQPIDPTAWREALGDGARVGDWIAFFGRRLDDRPWRAVLGEWVPLLSPGIVAAAFHGVIRTAHAVRSLEQMETPARCRELAEGLGYWAATYRALPESQRRAPQRRMPSKAIAQVKAVPAEMRFPGGNITDRLSPLDSFAPFAGVADLVDSTGDASAFISDLTETFARVYLVNVARRGSVITYIHGVTGPSAMRLLLPHLDVKARSEMLRYGWQAASGLYAASGGIPGAPSAVPDPRGSRDDLIDRALATGDEHAIKFTEACFREYALNPKPVYLEAARDAVERL
jgi:hypothetical protein